MLEEKDFAAIGALMDEKFKINNKILKDEIMFDVNQLITQKIDEVLAVVNEGFTAMQDHFDGKFDGLKIDVDILKDKTDVMQTDINVLKEDNVFLKEEMVKRPTTEAIFTRTDHRLTDLAIASDRHTYLHLDQMDQLPSDKEINVALVARGLQALA